MSDNGRNIVGAVSELRKCWSKIDKSAVISNARRYEVDWKFSPPLASHQSGAWERMIRIIRRVLFTRLYNERALTDDKIQTIFCEIENIVNSRPLTKVSADSTDAVSLTPNHFLMMHDNCMSSYGYFENAETVRQGWKHVQIVVNSYWKSWVRLYMLHLQARMKWLKRTPNLKVGDLVLLVDVLSARGDWPMGIIREIHPGSDGLVRSVLVKTRTSSFVRPI